MEHEHKYKPVNFFGDMSMSQCGCGAYEKTDNIEAQRVYLNRCVCGRPLVVGKAKKVGGEWKCGECVDAV